MPEHRFVAPDESPGATSSLALSIAAFTIAVNSDELSLSTTGAISRFETSSPLADLRLHASLGTPAVPEGAVTLFDSGGVWRLLRDDSGLIVVLEADVFEASPYLTAKLDFGISRGDIVIYPSVSRETSIYPLDYPLDEVLLGLLIANRGGVEFHCAGIIDERGGGHLFVAQSETGKTTTANLWLAEIPGCEVISDDRVVVRQDVGAAPMMYGTPWHGDGMLASARSADLRSITLLRQSPVNEFRPLSPSEATARLLACSFPPFSDAAAMSRTIDEIGRLTEKVPIGELGFAPDASAVHFAREKLGVA